MGCKIRLCLIKRQYNPGAYQRSSCHPTGPVLRWTAWESAADSCTSHVAIATVGLGCVCCESIHVAWQGLYTFSKTDVAEKWISQKWLSNETNKQTVLYWRWMWGLLVFDPGTEKINTFNYEYSPCDIIWNINIRITIALEINNSINLCCLWLIKVPVNIW